VSPARRDTPPAHGTGSAAGTGRVRGLAAAASAAGAGRPPSGGRMAAIFNLTAGGGAYQREVPAMLGILRGFGWQVTELPTEGAGHATELARHAVEDGYERICVLGGDGTVNEAINGMAGSGVPLAIVPLGTVNVLALELGIPLDPPAACQLAAEGTPTEIDLGKAGERYFSLMAGVGLDALVVAHVNPALKKTLKEAAFVLEGISAALTAHQPLVRIQCDEVCSEGYFIVLGNARNYGGTFGITPLADMRDGLLDVCVLKDRSFLGMAHYWLAALLSAHLQHPKVEYFRTARAYLSVVEDDGHADVLVQTDGELAGKLPLECRVVPRALSVVAP